MRAVLGQRLHGESAIERRPWAQWAPILGLQTGNFAAVLGAHHCQFTMLIDVALFVHKTYDIPLDEKA